MAIWQYEMQLVCPIATDLPDLARQISRILPEGVAWSEQMQLWGDDPGNTISFFVFGDDDEPCEVRVRLDLREPNLPLLKEILNLAVRNECVILSESGQSLEPTVQSILTDISASDAYRFVRDPKEFLDGLDT